MILYLAGNPQKREYEELVRLKAPVLNSFLGERGQIKKMSVNENRMMIDSGAHSWNKLTSMGQQAGMGGFESRSSLPDPRVYWKEYLTFLSEFPRPQNTTAVELDIYEHIPLVEITAWYREAKSLRMPFIRVYHRNLDDGKLTVLKQWMSEGQDYIGLGPDCIPIFPKIFALTRDKIKYHGFACLRNRLIEAYPFYSVDATTWLAGTRWRHSIVEGQQRRLTSQSAENNKLQFLQNGGDLHALNLLNIKYFARRQKYITELWRKRGVIWE